MEKLKALGLDGFQASFFHKYWDIEGEDVSGVVKEFFNGNCSITSINKTFITLIPKLKVPKSIFYFRPINL